MKEIFKLLDSSSESNRGSFESRLIFFIFIVVIYGYIVAENNGLPTILDGILYHFIK